MAPIQSLLLASLLSLFVGISATPTAFPDQYVEHALQKRAGLQIMKTTRTKTHIIDWIPIGSQGKIATAPPPRTPYVPDASKNISVPVAELMLPGAEKGPAGTVPVPRVNVDYLAAASTVKQPPKAPKSKRQFAGTHWYVSSDQPVTNHGGSAIYSLFDAYVANGGDFSLLQTAITRGNVPLPNSASTSSQTLEAGWINYPNQVQEPHLFTFYTTNGYAQQGNNVGGWNQDVTGWVQVDSSIFPGTVFKPNSVIGGSQYEIQIEYFLYQGNWWLWVLDRYIGYYPGSLYSANRPNAAATLAGGSDTIFFYGEIYQSEGPVTTTDMGSGKFAQTGFGQAAYIHNMFYTDVNDNGQDYTATFGDSDSARYNHDAHPSSGTNWGSYVYLGGPGAGGVVNG